MTPTDIDYARDPARNNAKDFIAHLIEDFSPIHGDRLSGDDQSVICGMGKLKGRSIAIIAQYPGRTIQERLEANSGMTRPMGYRKMQRLMTLASQFSLPILYLIDTPGADAGVDACRDNQSKAIADCLLMSSSYPHPSIAIILNQGMSGGAMSLACADELWMIKHAVFSVISPEGCAKIIWNDVTFSKKAAKILKITSQDMIDLNIIDQVLEDDYPTIETSLDQTFDVLLSQDSAVRLDRRIRRWDRHSVQHG